MALASKLGVHSADHVISESRVIFQRLGIGLIPSDRLWSDTRIVPI